jgi:ribosome biogenesis GTPase A|tara:strand:+ start:233 stop:406 length:174 start_codon:yes stop_codon:yes gene_type:complete
MGKTMVTKKETPLDKQTKREILESICTQKGWLITSKKATSLNRASKDILIDWHNDLI